MDKYRWELEIVDEVSVVRPIGVATVPDFLEIAVCPYYGLTRLALWDLRQTDLRNFDQQAWEDLSAGMKSTQHRRKVEWIGLVVKDQRDLVRLRYFTLIAAHQVEQSARHFLTCEMSEAWAWLWSMEGEQNPPVKAPDHVS